MWGEKVYSVGIFQNKFNSYPIAKTNAGIEKQTPVNNSVFAQNPMKQTTFTAAQPPLTIRTELVTNEEKEKFLKVASALNKNDRYTLELLLRNGKLLNTNSNDRSTTLDNLYNILAKPRHVGLDPENVLKETISTIANPYIITQQFGDIPKEYTQKIVELGKANSAPTSTNLLTIQKSQKPQGSEINEKTIDVRHSGACVAASIEFNLAMQMPAEFARFAEELSSPKVAVDKTIEMKNLANNTLDGIWLLNAFEVPYEMKDFNKAKLNLAPDKSAILRAQIQNSCKDPGERSLVDVLMQSTFMNVGSQQSYNSLTDIRKGKFNQNDRGLIEFEKTFTESVVEDKNKISVTYQIVDDNAKLTGYETDFATMKKHILDSLAMGENVIVGYTQIDDTNTVINGHEITIVSARQDKDGKLIFTCNDTDDNKPRAIEYSEDYLIPKIHHAGLPQEVVEKDVKFVDNWVEGINAYKQAKAEQQKQKIA